MDCRWARATLTAEHAELDQMLAEELTRPFLDSDRISGLKRMKLWIKDELAHLGNEEA